MNAELPQPEFTPVQWIQIMYPSEPNWHEVTDETLVGLVEAFEGELSCAGLTLGFLAQRRHQRAAELAHWLIAHDEADQWLKASAQDVLATTDGSG